MTEEQKARIIVTTDVLYHHLHHYMTNLEKENLYKVNEVFHSLCQTLSSIGDEVN